MQIKEASDKLIPHELNKLTNNALLDASSRPALTSKPKTIDKTTTPIISSNIAAETMHVPIGVFNLPSSFNVATVTETDVAVNIHP